MSTQQYSGSNSWVDGNGIKHTRLANGDIVQESASGTTAFFGLRAAGGEAFADPEEYEEYPHHHQQGAYVPQYTAQMVMPVQQVPKEKPKSKRSGSSSSSSSGHHCNCGHNCH